MRRKQVDGFRFRRQQAIGPYIVDFFCPEAQLVIEVDGGQHGEDNERDAARTAWLKRRGYRVMRFWNSDVLANTEGVLATILDGLASTDLRYKHRRTSQSR